MHILGDGNFTVFAPTNEAFTKIPEDDLNDLFADKDDLTGNLFKSIQLLNTFWNQRHQFTSIPRRKVSM